MKLAVIRVRSAPVRAEDGEGAAAGRPARTGSSSKNLILALRRRGLFGSIEEWEFGGREGALEGGRLPTRQLPLDPVELSRALARYADTDGRPDVLWIEGTAHPPQLASVFEACADTFKIVYSKYWKPWVVERLEQYDLCLLDDPSQEADVHRRVPAARCGVWDKLVDYDAVHRPVPSEKSYDVCYVAYLRERKNHELLFRAVARLGRPSLRVVCVGDERKDYRPTLERLAADLGLQVTFTGDLDPHKVNLYVNRSRVGVMCSVRDAAPRAILECLAADVPVVVNAELIAGARYVGVAAGVVCQAGEFHRGIAELLDHRDRYSPRAHLLANYDADTVVDRFVGLLAAAGLRGGVAAGLDRVPTIQR